MRINIAIASATKAFLVGFVRGCGLLGPNANGFTARAVLRKVASAIGLDYG